MGRRILGTPAARVGTGREGGEQTRLCGTRPGRRCRDGERGFTELASLLRLNTVWYVWCALSVISDRRLAVCYRSYASSAKHRRKHYVRHHIKCVYTYSDATKYLIVVIAVRSVDAAAIVQGRHR